MIYDLLFWHSGRCFGFLFIHYNEKIPQVTFMLLSEVNVIVLTIIHCSLTASIQSSVNKGYHFCYLLLESPHTCRSSNSSRGDVPFCEWSELLSSSSSPTAKSDASPAGTSLGGSKPDRSASPWSSSSYVRLHVDLVSSRKGTELNIHEMLGFIDIPLRSTFLPRTNPFSFFGFRVFHHKIDEPTPR